MKIYIIQMGEYSSKHIVGVTDNKDKADLLKNSMSGWFQEACVEEYDTDQFDSGLLRYKVDLTFNTAEVTFDEYNLYSDFKENTRIWDNEYIVYARDIEHAEKIARDMNAEYKAQQEGII